MNPKYLGFLRSLGAVVLFAVLSFLADAANLTPLLGDSLAALVAGVIGLIEHSLEKERGALFGAVKPVVDEE